MSKNQAPRPTSRGDDISTGEAAAWHHAIETAAAECSRIAADIRSRPSPPLDAAAHYENAARAILRLQPPQRIPTGLDGRGA